MVNDRFVVLRRSGLDEPEFRIDTQHLGRPNQPFGSAPIELTLEVEELSSTDVVALRRERDVEAITPVMPLRLVRPTASHEPSAASGVPWGLEAVGATTSPYRGAGITVAVLDTGIDRDHPAFAEVDVVENDFTGEGNGDRDGHGTHCAGTIFGSVVNGTRLGVAPAVDRALVGKVIGAAGASTEWLIDAILWALDEGANVISMSLGIDFPGAVATYIERGMAPEPATSRALEAYRANVDLFRTVSAFTRERGNIAQPAVIVAAAGNESRRDADRPYEIAVAPPAAAQGVISVGAVGQDAGTWRVAPFSNTRPNVAGPGVDIESASLDGGTVSMDGTSMATPHVAGVAALWGEYLLAKAGSMNATSLGSYLTGRTTLDGFAAGTDGSHVGTGLVQAPQ
jgi:subtilisin family serine protease